MKPTDSSSATPVLKEQLDRWDLKVKQADFLYKVVISLFGSIVAGLFLFYQYRQDQGRAFTEIQAAREKADSDLRATMFKTLTDAYFSASDSETQKGSSGGLERLTGLHREVLLGDLLARNFENIDIRPVFEDLDKRLAKEIGAPENSPDVQLAAFRQRQDLRRAALGATSRQTASLETVHSAVGRTQVEEFQVFQYCEAGPDGDPPVKTDPPDMSDVLAKLGNVEPVSLRDGSLILQIYSKKGEQVTIPRTINVSFFDMPALENLPLDDGQRIAFSLTSYISRTDCEHFSESMEGTSLRYCRDLYTAVDEPRLCAVGTARIVVLPSDFLGLRERPYQNDLLAGRYRGEPWYKFWR